MTPKEKAQELFDKYSKGKDEHGWPLCEFDSCAKLCALIAVDEIIEVLVNLSNGEFTYIHNVEYWMQVKQEIEKL